MNPVNPVVGDGAREKERRILHSGSMKGKQPIAMFTFERIVPLLVLLFGAALRGIAKIACTPDVHSYVTDDTRKRRAFIAHQAGRPSLFNSAA